MLTRLLIVGAALLSLTIGAHAQKVEPIEGQENPNSIQQQRVKELEGLREEIALAHHEDKLIERERLYKILKSAKSEAGGRYVADSIWRNWMDSAPNSEVADLVAQAMERRRWYDYDSALEILNQVVEKAPDYSEGYNQRAYILFLQEKFDQSLEDTDRAIELEPKHFAALSGKARILFHQGRHELAQKVLKKAVDVHPWIYERFLLVQTPEPGSEPAEIKRNSDEL